MSVSITSETLLPPQLRAGRALAGVTMAEIAQAAGVSDQTILRIESGATSPTRSTTSRIVAALAKFGVELIAETPASGIGVRMREPSGGIGFLRRDALSDGAEIGLMVRFEGRTATARVETTALDAGGDVVAALAEFDRRRAEILRSVAGKLSASDFDPDGFARIRAADLEAAAGGRS